ncbi:hypothetical protein BX616_002650, partial [Lobosporangium transversale]
TRRYGLPALVSAMAVDPVQGLLACGTFKGTIAVTGAPEIASYLELEEAVSVKMMAFQSGAPVLVVIDAKNAITVFDLIKKQRLLVRNARSVVTCMELLSGSNWLFHGLKDGTVDVFDVYKGQPVSYRIPNIIPEGRKHSIVVSIKTQPRDNNQLLIAYNTGVALWNLKTKSVIRTFIYKIPPGAMGGIAAAEGIIGINDYRYPHVTVIAWRPDGLGFVSGYDDGCFVFWDIHQEKPVLARTIHELQVNVPGTQPVFKRNASQFVPIYQLSWCLHHNKEDTTLIVAGGTGSMGDMFGLHMFEFPGKPDYSRPKCQRTLVMDTDILDFMVLPRDSPWLNGVLDPVSILILTNRGGIKAFSFNDSQTQQQQSLPAALSFVEPRLVLAKIYGHLTAEQHQRLVYGNQSLSDAPIAATRAPRVPLQGMQLARIDETKLCHDILVTAHDDSSVRFWEAASLKPLHHLTVELGHLFYKNQCEIVTLEFSVQSQILVVGFSNGNWVYGRLGSRSHSYISTYEQPQKDEDLSHQPSLVRTVIEGQPPLMNKQEEAVLAADLKRALDMEEKGHQLPHPGAKQPRSPQFVTNPTIDENPQQQQQQQPRAPQEIALPSVNSRGAPQLYEENHMIPAYQQQHHEQDRSSEPPQSHKQNSPDASQFVNAHENKQVQPEAINTQLEVPLRINSSHQSPSSPPPSSPGVKGLDNPNSCPPIDSDTIHIASSPFSPTTGNNKVDGGDDQNLRSGLTSSHSYPEPERVPSPLLPPRPIFMEISLPNVSEFASVVKSSIHSGRINQIAISACGLVAVSDEFYTLSITDTHSGKLLHVEDLKVVTLDRDKSMQTSGSHENNTQQSQSQPQAPRPSETTQNINHDQGSVDPQSLQRVGVVISTLEFVVSTTSDQDKLPSLLLIAGSTNGIYLVFAISPPSSYCQPISSPQSQQLQYQYQPQQQQPSVSNQRHVRRVEFFQTKEQYGSVHTSIINVISPNESNSNSNSNSNSSKITAGAGSEALHSTTSVSSISSAATSNTVSTSLTQPSISTGNYDPATHNPSYSPGASSRPEEGVTGYIQDSRSSLSDSSSIASGAGSATNSSSMQQQLQQSSIYATFKEAQDKAMTKAQQRLNYLVCVSEYGLRLHMNCTSRRINKIDLSSSVNNQPPLTSLTGKIMAANVIYHGGACCILCIMESGRILLFSVPKLELIPLPIPGGELYLPIVLQRERLKECKILFDARILVPIIKYEYRLYSLWGHDRWVHMPHGLVQERSVESSNYIRLYDHSIRIPPRPSFVQASKGWFGFGSSSQHAEEATSQEDLDELLGGEHYKAVNPVLKRAGAHGPPGVAPPVPSKNGDASSSNGGLAGMMGNTLEGLDERGKRLGELGDKTAEMSAMSNDFLAAARELNAKNANKKWYEF